MKQYIVYMGNYGSGKTELSLNTALYLVERGETVLCDMDIVNPYFRSAESEDMLQQKGVRLIAPPFANTTVDVPALSAEVHAAFLSEQAVFDAGGDPVGATALGGYHAEFDQVMDNLSVYYVVNARRPFQENIDDAAVMLDQIQGSSRLRITGLINNTNMAGETTVDDLHAGERLCEQLSDRTGLPVAFASGTPDVLDEYVAQGYKGDIFPIQIYTRPEWLDGTRHI